MTSIQIYMNNHDLEKAWINTYLHVSKYATSDIRSNEKTIEKCFVVVLNFVNSLKLSTENISSPLRLQYLAKSSYFKGFLLALQKHGDLSGYNSEKLNYRDIKQPLIYYPTDYFIESIKYCIDLKKTGYKQVSFEEIEKLVDKSYSMANDHLNNLLDAQLSTDVDNKIKINNIKKKVCELYDLFKSTNFQLNKTNNMSISRKRNFQNLSNQNRVAVDISEKQNIYSSRKKSLKIEVLQG